MKKVKVVASLIILLGIGIFFWTRRGNEGHDLGPPSSITIGTFSKALGNSPYYVARHFKWFEDHPELKGVKIIYKEYNDRPSISDALSHGELQALFCAEVPAILCRAQGNDIRIVALSANVDQNILVRTELPYQSVPELKGKSIAVLQGTSSHYCLLKILKAFEMKEADVDLRYMPPAEAKAAFESGKIDAWAVWAPFVEQQEVSGKGRLVKGGDAMINSVVSLSAPFSKEHHRAAAAVVSCVLRAKKWIAEHSQEAQQIAAQEVGLDPKVVETAWPKHRWDASLDQAVITDIQEKATFLAESDKTRASKKLDVRSELIDSQFLAGDGK